MFILFDDNTSRSYSPYTVPQVVPTVQFNTLYGIDRYYVFFLSKLIDDSNKFILFLTTAIQVLKSSSASPLRLMFSKGIWCEQNGGALLYYELAGQRKVL